MLLARQKEPRKQIKLYQLKQNTLLKVTVNHNNNKRKKYKMSTNSTLTLQPIFSKLRSIISFFKMPPKHSLRAADLMLKNIISKP